MMAVGVRVTTMEQEAGEFTSGQTVQRPLHNLLVMLRPSLIGPGGITGEKNTKGVT